MERGEIWWADLPDADGSSPSGRRPVLVVQTNPFNNSRLQTVIVAIMTSNLGRASAPGNVLVTAIQAGLPRDSVINISQLFTVDKSSLTERVGNLPARLMRETEEGLRLVLGL